VTDTPSLDTENQRRKQKTQVRVEVCHYEKDRASYVGHRTAPLGDPREHQLLNFIPLVGLYTRERRRVAHGPWTQEWHKHCTRMAIGYSRVDEPNSIY
jgi:hypothetical protein